MDSVDRIVTYSIAGRRRQCKDVIASWTGTIEEFLEEVDETEKIVNCEKLKRKRYDEKSKTYKCNSKSTDHLIVTIKGDKLPETIDMCGKILKMFIKPFVENVI